jgi:hypothetical protein
MGLGAVVVIPKPIDAAAKSDAFQKMHQKLRDIGTRATTVIVHCLAPIGALLKEPLRHASSSAADGGVLAVSYS